MQGLIKIFLSPAIIHWLVIDAYTESGLIMGCHHQDYPVFGVQFHPESIASVGGYRMLLQFLQSTGLNGPDAESLSTLEAQILRLDQKFPGQIHA